MKKFLKISVITLRGKLVLPKRERLYPNDSKECTSHIHQALMKLYTRLTRKAGFITPNLANEDVIPQME